MPSQFLIDLMSQKDENKRHLKSLYQCLKKYQSRPIDDTWVEDLWDELMVQPLPMSVAKKVPLFWNQLCMFRRPIWQAAFLNRLQVFCHKHPCDLTHKLYQALMDEYQQNNN